MVGVDWAEPIDVCVVRDTIAKQLCGIVDDDTGLWMFYNKSLALSHAGLCLMCQAVDKGGFNYILKQLSGYGVPGGKYPRDTTVVGFSSRRKRSKLSTQKRDQVLFYIVFSETAKGEYDFCFAVPNYEMELKFCGLPPPAEAASDNRTRRKTPLIFVKPGLVPVEPDD